MCLPRRLLDGEEKVAPNVVLKWEGGDPDPDETVAYDVYFGKNQDPPLMAEGHEESSYAPGELIIKTNYYWKVVSRDSHGGVTEGPVWAFTTLIPGVIQFAEENYTALESDGTAVITVSRSDGSQGQVSVDYETVEGTAKPDLDYVHTSGTLVFEDGETEKTFTVQLIDDLRAEPDETVELVLRDPQGGAILGTITTATLTIIDDPTDVIAGDVNNDKTVDLADLILALQLMSNMTGITYVFEGADINDDGRIGIEEVLYILQFVSGMREAHVWP